MAFTQVYNRLEKVLKRYLSDDYDSDEPALRKGSGYTVSIGDVDFSVRHRSYDLYGFHVSVDGVHVMSYVFPKVLHARFNDEPAQQTWHHDSPTLREHVRRAAVEVDKRFRAKERERERRDRDDREQAARKLKNFQDRFGIPA